MECPHRNALHPVRALRNDLLDPGYMAAHYWAFIYPTFSYVIHLV